ncbi:PAB-dependent poly(A)-specific ribonuclease subunit PAN3 [Rasamsonia emersonii CBS 393.64]|uniref:PAB-dependent poly(A)-specific ribonuclease subunit PAN3 n=1 Tax=Rasamsonia emersonii (strain ATCC 16479 / CBS 393.64 / IMI 116815) TaxID=1408163 RepID=A0A0F4YHJ0_RASE3|nr:PAB-dependent poly(A)-specific ribonuclease subunit PAN3 [Rasamsonia emersonii CBS 393.64]KKA17634.1 PAB-dependent poly(A)-specific ribonuclease subunit PAN3 [Rasamsonia emersonii CBS 393.64]
MTPRNSALRIKTTGLDTSRDRYPFAGSESQPGRAKSVQWLISMVIDSSKKRLNVDSPSFTPSHLAANGSSAPKKPTSSISPKAASAAPFQPKSLNSRSNTSTPSSRPETTTQDWSVAEVQDFVPQGYDASQVPIMASSGDSPGSLNALANPFEPRIVRSTSLPFAFSPGSPSPTLDVPLQTPRISPVPRPTLSMSARRATRSDADLMVSQVSLQGNGNGVINPAASYDPFVATPTPLAGGAAGVTPVQANPYSHDPAAAAAAAATLGGATFFPGQAGYQQPAQYHLYAPIGPHSQNLMGYQRHVHDLFLPNDFREELQKKAAATLQTLPKQHLGAGNRYQNRHNNNAHVPEQVLWSYMTQIASALKTIHSNGLAARIIDPSKIILTGKNRIRLNACAIMDVVQHDTQRSISDLQQQDLVNFGQLILTLGANSPNLMNNPNKAMEHFSRTYSPQLKNSVFWLLNAMQKDQERNIDVFISGISSQLISTFDSALHMDDQLTSDLSRELENGRLVRLLTKLNFINERPEYEHDRQWSENGERYFLKLFRDYVFHQVDAQNNPVVDLGHVLTCLNKLDAGTEEKITLISRDEQSCFIVSYKELKKALESSFQALMKPTRRMH